MIRKGPASQSVPGGMGILLPCFILSLATKLYKIRSSTATLASATPSTSRLLNGVGGMPDRQTKALNLICASLGGEAQVPLSGLSQ
jgi:hypothetical protein